MISRLRRLRQIKTAAALRERCLKSQKRSATLNRVPLQIELAVFAIKARDFRVPFRDQRRASSNPRVYRAQLCLGPRQARL